MASQGPSLPGAFNILGAAGRDKLLYLKNKLRTLHPGCHGADLLHAMVLLMLGQDTEARISLEALKADTVAQLVARQWAGMDSAEAQEEPPDVSWAVARLYHLLAEEKLCPSSMRDVAYRVALRALNSQDDHRLGELQKEARERCGWDIVKDHGGFLPLRSDLGCLPPSSASPSGTRSQPRPIHNPSGWSRGQSLRSTGSPASLACNLEISQSPTMAFLSPHCSAHGPSKLSDAPQASPEPEPVPTGGQQPEEFSWPPSVEPASHLELLDSPGLPEVAHELTSAGPLDSPAAPETSFHHLVASTEVSADLKPLPLPTVDPLENPCPANDQAPPQLSVEDTTSQNTLSPRPAPSAPQTSPLKPSASPSSSPSFTCSVPPATSSPLSPSPSSFPLESSEQKFYNFVVLHARADEHVALRVRERLESLGVPDGATFCEDFQVPGRGELRCLQDAIDHSGFIILLLTSNFDCRLSLHQLNQALMSSFTQQGRQDSVVPFLPLESSTERLGPNTATLLASLVWLDEHSQIFARKVANTFKPHKLRARKAHWRMEQDARAVREHSQQLDGQRQQVAAMHAAYTTYLQSCLAWQSQTDKLQMAFGTDLSLGTQVPYPTQVPLGDQVPLGTPPTFPTWPGCPRPLLLHPWQAGATSPGFPQPPTFPQPPAFSQPPAFPQTPTFPPASPAPPGTPGPQPLIIHHAQMVQLGLNNHMWNQRGAQGSEDKTDQG